MANTKISGMTDGTAGQSGDQIPVARSGANVQLTLTKLLAFMGPILNSVASADVSLNNTGTYFDGPSCAQGTAGTWVAIGTVTVQDTAGAGVFNAKLWDGTSVITSAKSQTSAATVNGVMTLVGFLASPAGNIRISVNDSASTSGLIKFNASGLSKDSSLLVFRIA